MNKLLNNYIGLVDFLADFLGDDVEVVLHDLSNFDESVVAIRNNHISGRTIGAPATDLVLKVVKNEKYKNTNYITNYKGTSIQGMELKSATYFIRNNKGTVEGILCINMDISKMKQMKTFIDNIISFDSSKNLVEDVSETLSQSAQDLALDSIEKVITSFSIPPERMDKEEKIAVVRELNEQGVFLIKGAIFLTAKSLNVSEATIYRYLSNLKRDLN